MAIMRATIERTMRTHLIPQVSRCHTAAASRIDIGIQPCPQQSQQQGLCAQQRQCQWGLRR